MVQVQCHHPYGGGPFDLFYVVEVELTILAWMWVHTVRYLYGKTWIITGSNLHPGSAFRNFKPLTIQSRSNSARALRACGSDSSEGAKRVTVVSFN